MYMYVLCTGLLTSLCNTNTLPHPFNIFFMYMYMYVSNSCSYTGTGLASFPGHKNERPGTHCMRMRSIPQNLGNPVILVNYCSFLQLENETSLDARLPSILTNVKIEGGRGYRPGSKPLYVTQRQQTFMAFVYLLHVCFRIPI